MSEKNNNTDNVLKLTEREYITDRLENQIKFYSDGSKKNKFKYKWLSIIELLFSLSIPVLNLIEIDSSPIWTSIIATLIALIEGLKAINKYHENWISYRTTAENLKHEKYLYLAESSDFNGNPEKYKLLVERVESLISKENTNWSKLISTTEKKK